MGLPVLIPFADEGAAGVLMEGDGIRSGWKFGGNLDVPVEIKGEGIGFVSALGVGVSDSGAGKLAENPGEDCAE